jgi:cytochrome c5
MTQRLPRLALGAALAAGVLLAAAGAAFAVTWKSETVTLPYPGPHFTGHGAALLNASCSTCHSADFVNEQPHLALGTWKVEVLKMKNVFHAPVHAKDVDTLARILFDRHPVSK